MGITCCKKLYYLNVEDDELQTGNFDSRRKSCGEFDDDFLCQKQNSIVNNNNTSLNNSPQNPFKDKVKPIIHGAAIPFQLYDLETSIKKKRELDFAVSFTLELNRCRLNPDNYAYKIQSHMKYIKQDNSSTKNIQFVYHREGEEKIPLNKGKQAFEDCIELLNKLQKLEPVDICNDLAIPVPDDTDLWADKEYLKRASTDKRVEFKEIIDSSFHFDIGSPNPEVSLIMQLVDDTWFKGMRRNNLLNESMRFIGVSNCIKNNISCNYFFLASNIERNNVD